MYFHLFCIIELMSYWVIGLLWILDFRIQNLEFRIKIESAQKIRSFVINRHESTYITLSLFSNLSVMLYVDLYILKSTF
ncbi:MAG: hypothetical protein EA361_02690 [Bacteroidetes bacterium]|nr:MAG: hypothetical protein EA361_02690 [Bacteroidota bacterium]